jgi:hypothetical protein
MHLLRPNPVDSFDNLRGRIDRLFRLGGQKQRDLSQGTLDIDWRAEPEKSIAHPSRSIAEFLNFISDVVPDGDVYLFGGVLRDVALFGRRGFTSDVDLVVEGNWTHCVKYLASLRAEKNKFGGFRLHIADWPIDIWNARDTWAIREGFVAYKGIASLTETTVLNWDAILMNWRTGNFIYRPAYLDELRTRALDIVLEANPNPLGMTVRVFRHLCSKDAKRISRAAAKFLADSTLGHSYDEIRREEIRSYGNSLIEPAMYELFERMNDADHFDISQRFRSASDMLRRELELS